jgi:hypothetical protein
MKPFQIQDPNKVYTAEELQKNSPYPLFDDFYVGENPKNIDIYNNYTKKDKFSNDGYYPLEERFIKYLPLYIQIYAKEISIGPKDDVRIIIDFTEEVANAACLHHGLSEISSKSNIMKILKKDVDDFYKKFGAERGIRALE